MSVSEQTVLPDQIPLVVFDTGIVLAAAFNPAGVAMKALRLMEDQKITVFVSNRLRHEYEALLRHPAHQQRYPFLTGPYIDAEMDRFDTYATRIPNPPTAFAYTRDPNDEPLINLIVAIKADYLVTLDKDLLTLPQYPDFASLPHQTSVLKPGDFLADIEKRKFLQEEQRGEDNAIVFYEGIKPDAG